MDEKKENVKKAKKEKKEKKEKKRKGKAEVVEKDYNGATNYNVYHMSKAEVIFYTLVAAVLLFGLGFIFYHNVIISFLFSLLALKYPKIKEKDLIKKRKKQLTLQFKDMLYSLSSAVSSGNSVEHALVIARDDMVNQYGESNVFIVEELDLMVSRISINQNIEEVLADFAERSGIEDVKTFADIFEVAKRTGGNLVQIIRQSTDVIADKIEIETEMDTMLSGKKMEQKVVTVMPILLTLFMTVSTDGFMDPIFTTQEGMVTATIALALILAGAFWSQSITNIEI